MLILNDPLAGELNTNVFDSEVHQTESLLADCNSLMTELSTIDASRKEAQEVRSG
jgi:hypothetical protein